MAQGIIIAVSDPHIRYLLQRYAEEYGFGAIDTPANSEVAERARRVCPRLIVLEVDSPGTDDLPALRQLRADPATCEIPVIAYISGAVEGAESGEGFGVCLHEALMYEDFAAAVRRCGETAPSVTGSRGGALAQGDS